MITKWVFPFPFVAFLISIKFYLVVEGSFREISFEIQEIDGNSTDSSIADTHTPSDVICVAKCTREFFCVAACFNSESGLCRLLFQVSNLGQHHQILCYIKKKEPFPTISEEETSSSIAPITSTTSSCCEEETINEHQNEKTTTSASENFKESYYTFHKTGYSTPKDYLCPDQSFLIGIGLMDLAGYWYQNEYLCMDLKVSRSSNTKLETKADTFEQSTFCFDQYTSGRKGTAVGFEKTNTGLNLICNELDTSAAVDWIINPYNGIYTNSDENSLPFRVTSYTSGKWTTCPLGIIDSKTVWIVDGIYEYGSLEKPRIGVKCVNMTFLSGNLAQLIEN